MTDFDLQYKSYTDKMAKAIKEDIGSRVGNGTASDISYDNSSSSLNSNSVQGAIDELDSTVEQLELDGHTHTNQAILEGTEESFTTLLKGRLVGIEDGATADQTKADIDALGINAITVTGNTVETDVPPNALFTDTIYDDTSLQAEVDLNTAKETNVTTDLSNTPTVSTVTVHSSDGIDTLLAGATDTLAGVMTTTDKTKLDSVEAGATDDLTATEIEGLYEGLADTNKYTDAEKVKVANMDNSFKGLFADATARDAGVPSPINGDYVIQDDTDSMHFYDGTSWVNTGNTSTGDMVKAVYDPTNVSGDAFSMNSMVETTTGKVMTDVERVKLAGIEDGATADQTKADIDTLGVDAGTVTGNTVETDVPVGAVFTDTTYTAGDFNHDDLANLPTHAPSDADNTASNETSHTDVLVDGDTVSLVSPTNKLVTQVDLGNAGYGDMFKSVYDISGSGVVDNAEKVNNLTVETAVPVNAVFTDTVYNDIGVVKTTDQYLEDVTAGTGVVVDKTDLKNPVISVDVANIELPLLFGDTPPTTSENPTSKDVLYVDNGGDEAIYICFDATPNANIWVKQQTETTVAKNTVNNYKSM